VKKAVSSKAVELIYGSKVYMSRIVRGKRSARKTLLKINAIRIQPHFILALKKSATWAVSS